MDLKRHRGCVWSAFWLFVLFSWTFLVLWSFAAGHGSCEVSGTCDIDAIVGVIGVFLIPLQVFLFVFLRDRTIG